MIRVFGLILVLNVIYLDIASIRNSYKAAIYSKEEAQQLLDELESITVQSPLRYAYKGATYALLAQFQFNPYSNLESVKKGSSILDDAVLASSGNIEIRYLRYSIEKNLPAFLPYKKHILQDEGRIVIALIDKNDGLDPEIRTEVISYMLKNAQLSPDNKRGLEELTN